MSAPRKPLSGILPGNDDLHDDVFELFDATEAADDFDPLPRGTYIALAVGGKHDQARTGTRGYTVEFRVTEGEYVGRRLWMTKYFTKDAMKYSKAALAKLGITDGEQLRRPFPANRMVCKLVVTLRRLDDGTERNEVKTFDVIRVQEPTADPFAPSADGPKEANPADDNPFGANGGDGQ